MQLQVHLEKYYLIEHSKIIEYIQYYQELLLHLLRKNAYQISQFGSAALTEDQLALLPVQDIQV